MRWVLEVNKGSRRQPKWREVLCWIGNERQGADLAYRFEGWGKHATRWHPIGDETQCSYAPFGPHDKGEFD
jgi:hypothetical protein